MTKNIRRWLLASLAVAAVGVSGCVLTSAQILAAFDLPNPFTIVSTGSPPVGSVDVDLNSVSDYADNKDKLKGLTDLALLGKFENVSGPAGAVEIWMTADHTTNFTTVGQITGGATKVWGPFEIGATGSVVGIAAGIFGQKALGGMGGVSIISQLAGSLSAVAFALASGFIVYGILDKTIGIRLSQEDEFAGADVSIHNIGAYPEDHIR